jgi:hypothetical protein
VRVVRPLVLLFVTALLAGCGGSGSPLTPVAGPGPLNAPSAFAVTLQKVNATNNEVSMSWTGTESSYQLTIGTTSGGSNSLNTTVTGTSFTWTSPRTGGSYFARVASKRGESTSSPSSEITIFVLDIRNVIDAMIFHSGPMADSPNNALTNPPAAVWADGTRLRVIVSAEAGETVRAMAQTFADQYAALVGGAVTATTEMSTDTFASLTTPTNLAEFTIAVRIKNGFCTEGALGCAFYGPAPVGANRSFVTLAQTGGLFLSATGHEMGHTYGMGHIATPQSGRPEFRFMMHNSASSEQMTDVEKLAVTLARAAGLRSGWTRNQALAADLVNPFTGSSNVSYVRGAAASTERRTSSGWILVDAIRKH